MREDRLAEDLAAVESALGSRRRPEAGVDLRLRVLAAVRQELAREGARPGGRLSGWQFAAAAAAVVLVGMNLAMMAGRGGGPDLRWQGENGTASAAGAIARLVPDLPQREARRQALLLRAGRGLARAPALRPTLPPVWGRGGTGLVAEDAQAP